MGAMSERSSGSAKPEVARPELALLAVRPTIGGCIDAGRTAGCGRS